ncbi:MAG: HDIG domain-containing metalloprotein [Balneolaceae bacterium]
MGLLQKLGLGRKRKKDEAVLLGDKARVDQQKVKKKRFYIRLTIFLAFFAVVIYALPQSSFRQVANYTVGEPWMADDLTAPFTFSLKKAEAELEAEREQIRENTEPVFHINHNVQNTIPGRIDSVYQALQPVLDAWVQWRRADLNPDLQAENDSLRFEEERAASSINLSDTSWETLLESYSETRLNNLPADQFLGNEIASQLEILTGELLNTGIIDLDKMDLPQNELIIRDLVHRTQRTVSLTTVRDLDEAGEYARYYLSTEFGPEESRLATDLFMMVILPNWIFSEEDTEIRLQEAMADISTTKGAVAQGQVIIRRGDIVDEEISNTLRSLAEARAEAATDLERWLRYGGEVLVIGVAILFFLFYLYLYRRPIYENNAMFLLVFLIMGAICLASGLLYDFNDLSPYLVPIAIAPLILTIIFDSRVGLLAAIALAIITAIYNDNNFEYLIATLMACGFGIFSVRDINKRTQFFVTTPLVIISSYLFVISGFALTRFAGWESYLDDLLFIMMNALFILFTYPLILFLEKAFNITTDFTLLELSDTNLPLLKELMNKAPGTFHHSLQVANLAESAASAIGANALKCRVGALYHDIGKMKKPGYFIENQSGRNEHDKLKPRMSALVIKAHVSDGVSMANDYDLPDVIIDFIRTHHGTSLIRYFYDKAQKETGNESEIQEEDYRYDGPLPFTRETGIMLLADGVEAASRSMKDPTYSKLENLINRLIDENVHEGQLRHCPITFHQLDIIKKTFLNILVGVYHSRIEYPESDDESPHPSRSGASESRKESKSRKQEPAQEKQESDGE